MPVAKVKTPIVMQYRLAGFSASQIAGFLGCTSAAVHHTMAEPEFKQEYEARKDEVLQDVREQAASYIGLAVATWAEIVLDREASHGDRIRAGKELADRFGLVAGSTVQHTGEGVVVNPAPPSPEPTRQRLVPTIEDPTKKES